MGGNYNLDSYPEFTGAPGFAAENLLVDEPANPLANDMAGWMAARYPEAHLFLVVEALDARVYASLEGSPKLAGRPGSTFGTRDMKRDALGREPACFVFSSEPEFYLFARELKREAPYVRLHMRLREEGDQVVSL